jgi:F-type H+-transporting ATPase subunit epsilon
MDVQLITPETTVFSGTAASVGVPGIMGDFGVLPGHAPFISTIRPGIITIESEAGVRKLAVKGGIAEVTPERCRLLTQSVQDVTSTTAAEAQTALQEARAAVAAADGDSARSEAALNLALAEAIALSF